MRVTVNQLAISRDGSRVALQVTRPLSAGGPFAGEVRYDLDLRGELWLLSQRMGSPQPLSLGTRGVWSPSFSPDGRRLAALTLAGPGKVGFVVWELETGQYRLFLDLNLDIYFAHLRSASAAYAAPSGSMPIPLRYLWLDPTSILFVDHGPSPQQFFLAPSDVSVTLQTLREHTLSGDSSVRIWDSRSATCGVGGRLARLGCDTGEVETLYEGDVRGVSVSPDMQSAALLVATGILPPIPNAPVDAPLGMTEIGEPMVKLKLTLLNLSHRGTARDIKGVMAVGEVPPGRLPVWSEDSTRIAVPVRTTYSNAPSTGNDATWEVVAGTHETRRWAASSYLDAELLAALLTTSGLNKQSVIAQRPMLIRSGDYGEVTVRGGAWRCSPTQVLFWNAPALTLIGPTGNTILPGHFTSVLPPVGNHARSRALAVSTDGRASLVTTWDDRYRVEDLPTAPEWRLLGVSPNYARAVYVDDTNAGTFLKSTRPKERPRTSVLSFNTYFRDVLRPQRTMLTCTFTGGTVRKGVLQLPIGHRPGQRHPVIVYAYPNFVPSFSNAIARINCEISVSYPVQYLLANGFAFFQAPFPISGRSKNPMHAAAQAVIPWLDVLDRQTEVIPGEYGCWGHSNGGYVALSLEALTHRFKAIVAWATFPEVGFSDLHSNSFVFALNCGGNVIQDWRGVAEDPKAGPYNPRPTLPWKNPAKYIRNDPLFNLGDASTPLLLVEGELDNSPMEMEEVYSILRARGVPVELAFYWGEGHNFASPGNIRDSWLRTEKFFRKYLRMR